MNRRTQWLPRLAPILLLTVLVSGCSRKVGWGLVLWSFDETPVQAAQADGEGAGEAKPAAVPAEEPRRVSSGSVVPVLIKSNINHVYVIEAPDSHKKVEVPIWQIEVFRSRRDAEKRAEEFAPNASLYAVALRDGLVLREEPRNTADQVFRLRRNQQIKLLGKSAGEVVTTGGQALEGDWYLAMGDDGTRGYVFSNQLRIYDEAKAGTPELEASDDGSVAAELEPLFVHTWRPAYFRTMIEEGRVDLERFGSQYGIFVDAVRRQIRIEYPGASRFFNYTTIEREPKGGYRFKDLPLTIAFREDGAMDVTIESDYGAGTYAFLPFDGDVRETVRREELRRSNLLAALVARGARFVSEEWGALTIGRTGRFTWAAYDKLIPEVIPEYSGDAGNVNPALFLGPTLVGEWTGGLSFSFDGGLKPRADFLYRFTEYGLELQLVRPIDKEWAMVNNLSEPALELKFRRAAP